MLLRQILLPRPQIPCFMCIVRHRLSIPWYHELPNLKLGVGDRTTRDTSVRRPVETSVHDILAPKPTHVSQVKPSGPPGESHSPSVAVFPVNVVNKPVLGHNEIRCRSRSLRFCDYVSQENDWIWMGCSHDSSEFRRLELPVQWCFLYLMPSNDDTVTRHAKVSSFVSKHGWARTVPWPLCATTTVTFTP